jgi:hypothetical protein
MKNIWKKSIVISIILLLVGVSVSSAMSVDSESTISNNESEECRECNEVDNRQLDVLEKHLNRLEVYSKLLLVISKSNPVLNKIKLLSTIISNQINIYNKLTEIICISLFFIELSFLPVLITIEISMYKFEEDSLIYKILLSIHLQIQKIVNFIVDIMERLECEIDVYPPLQ